MAPMQAELYLATCQRTLPPRDKRKRATGGDNIVCNRRLGQGTGQLVKATGTLRSYDKTKQYPGLLP